VTGGFTVDSATGAVPTVTAIRCATSIGGLGSGVALIK
jgi:hypothetical protein